ncbi:hypothetical protein [Salinicola rhizosphaerae]|uniref:hypothetical protein n=1 Tax=Salinicola rhizosphaerae TaxID=1443141 RepID=UPI0016787F6D|nr:hypothetical protein [Salinicola rhizosphaerae]
MNRFSSLSTKDIAKAVPVFKNTFNYSNLKTDHIDHEEGGLYAAAKDLRKPPKSVSKNRRIKADFRSNQCNQQLALSQKEDTSTRKGGFRVSLYSDFSRTFERRA